MSDEQKKYPSRLQGGRQPIQRGIGSGFAENQRLAGAQNPELAAREAARPESERTAQSDREIKHQEQLDNLIEDIALAITDKVFIPDVPQGLPDTSDHKALIAFIQRQPIATIQKWHEDAQSAYDDKIKNEDAAILEDQFNTSARIDPGSPLYDPMMDAGRRERIEENLQPLDFEEMVFRGYTSQDVPLRDNFTVTFRTIPTQHSLWLEWMMARTEESSLQHTKHLYSLYLLAASLDAVNGRSIGPDLTKHVTETKEARESFEASMKERLKFLGKLPGIITDDLIIQNVWFMGRVRRLVAGDLMRKVGNS